MLCLSSNGLTFDEIWQSAEVSQTVLAIFKKLFRVFLLQTRDVYTITPNSLREYVTQLPDMGSVVSKAEITERIIHALEKSDNSIRRLDELTYHLYQTGQHFKLKETVINIENFLLLFNPQSKFDLCRYWQRLE